MPPDRELPAQQHALGAAPAESAAAVRHEGGARPPHLTGYFPQWALYDEPQYLVRDLVSSHAAGMLDQVNYAQGFVTNGHCSVADPNADLRYTFSAAQSVDGVADGPAQPFRGSLNQMRKLKRAFPGLKVVISLEGRGSDFAQDAQPANREAFVASCVDVFLKGNFAAEIHEPGLFDGIDVDWEFPGEEGSANFLGLLTEFRRQMNALRPGLLLDVAVGPSPRMMGIADAPNAAALAGLVDQVGIMTYDFAGPWTHMTAFGAPLSLPPGIPGGSVQRSVQAWLAAGVPARKLLVGVPFYGYGWHVLPPAPVQAAAGDGSPPGSSGEAPMARDGQAAPAVPANGLFQPANPIRRDHTYAEIASLVPQSTVFRDPDSQTPWLFDGSAFWTFDDPVSIGKKADFVVGEQLGGMMIWELGQDTADAALLHSAYDGLHAKRASAIEASHSAILVAPSSAAIRGSR